MSQYLPRVGLCCSPNNADNRHFIQCIASRFWSGFPQMADFFLTNNFASNVSCNSVTTSPHESCLLPNQIKNRISQINASYNTSENTFSRLGGYCIDFTNW
jgi:hypothetical protein